jgi:hypothetical protein
MAYFTDNPTAASFNSGDIIPLSRSTTDYKIDADDILIHLDTDALDEGATNLYYSAERVDDRVDALIQNGTGITWVYNDGAGTLTPTVSLGSFTTDNLSESSTLKYVTNGTMALTNAQILALNSTPVELVPALADNVNVLIGAVIKSVNAPAGNYTNNGLDIIDSTNSTVLATVPLGALNHATTTVYNFALFSTGVPIKIASAIQIKANTTDPTGGNAANATTIYFMYQRISVA